MKTLQVLLACCVAAAAPAAVLPSTAISMFGSYVNEDTYGEESEFGNLQPLTAWFIADCRINKRSHMVGVAAVDGPDKYMRLLDLRYHWKPKRKTWWLAPWLSDITAGYFIPPFTREWSTLNPFQVGTVRYTGMADSLVVRDAGIQLDFVPAGSFSGTFAFFLDDRAGGYMGEVRNTHRHTYFRIRRPLLYGIMAGAYRRQTTRDRNPWAVELTRQSEASLYAFELLYEDGMSQWYVLAERDIRHRMPEQGGGIRLVGRFEDLRYGKRLVLGCALFPDEGIAVKANYVYESYPQSGNHKLLLQGIAHFDFPR